MDNWKKTIIGISIFLLFIMIISYDSEPKSEPENKVHVPDDIEVCVMTQQFVTDNLKAPSTAKFPSCRNVIIHKLEANTWIVNGYVDSQNGFGAMIRTKYSAEIYNIPNTDRWRLIRVEVI